MLSLPCSLWLCLFGQLGVAGPAHIQQQMFSRLEELDSGSFLLVVDVQKPVQRQLKIHYYFDSRGGRKRSDFWQNSVSVRSPDGLVVKNSRGNSEFERRVIVNNERYIHYVPESFQDGTSISIRTGDASEAQDISVVFMEPALLGVLPVQFGVFYSYDIEKFKQLLLTSNLTFGTNVLQTVSGHECWELRYSLSNNRVLQLYVAPGLDYGVVRARLSVPGADKNVRVSICDSEYVYDAEKEFWHPKQVHFEQKQGEDLLKKELWTVSESQWNQMPEEQVFTLSGLNIPPGRIISSGLSIDEAPQGYMVWDGRKAVQPPSPGRAEPGQRLPGWVVVLICINGGAGILLLFVYWRMRRSSINKNNTVSQ